MYDTIENKKIKICFVSLGSYALLTEKKVNDAGGAEMQQVKLSKELEKRGYDISFIVYGENHHNINLTNGIKILSVCGVNDVKDNNFLKKALCIYRKMKEANADIYYYRAGSPGITTLFCWINKKKIILHIASDATVTGDTIINKNSVVHLLNKIGNWIDIRLSDMVIAQTCFQKSKLKERFNVDSNIIRNFLDLSFNYNKNFISDSLLWVGTIKFVKQPELFLKIAQYFPEKKFVMIGGEEESSELFKKIKNAAENMQNVEFKGFVHPQEIYDYYQKAILLINTSRIEGFPNVFLEAWSCSIPVVSLNVDPDGIITKYKLGYCSKTFEQMIRDVNTLLHNEDLRNEMGINAKKYVEQNHDMKKIADQFEKLISSL